MRVILPPRRRDDYGLGHFGASRGKRKHNGIDYACMPESKVFSPVEGEVTKLGYPYGDNPYYRYVQVTTKEGYNVRSFYVEPYVEVGDYVSESSIIGISQSLDKRYPGITEHIHLEIKDLQGKYINPKHLNL